METSALTYPVTGALAMARLRGAIAGGDLSEAVVIASSIDVGLLVAELGDQVAARPWGCAIAAGPRQGIVVLAGGLAIAYSGRDWESFVFGASMGDELKWPNTTGWVMTPEGQRQSLGFAAGPEGALAATAALGVMMHIGLDLPTPLGLGGKVTGPGGAEVKGRDAWDSFLRLPDLWVAAARLYGAERVLEAVTNRVNEQGPDTDKVLRALWPGAEIVMLDDAGDRWRVGDLIVAAEPEAWQVGKSNGYFVTRWRINTEQ